MHNMGQRFAYSPACIAAACQTLHLLKACDCEWGTHSLLLCLCSVCTLFSPHLTTYSPAGGAMFGLGNLAGLVKDGHVPGAITTYLAASAGTALGAATGTTPLIIAAESAVGIKEGGRTGLVSLTVAGCFLCSMFLAPFMQVGVCGGEAGGNCVFFCPSVVCVASQSATLDIAAMGQEPLESTQH